MQFTTKQTVGLTGASVKRGFSRVMVVSLVLAGPPANAELLAKPDGWKRLDVPNQPAATFTFTPAGGLTVQTHKSVSFLYRDITGDNTPALSWRWRLEEAFTHTDLTAKGMDDRPLAVHLWFSDPDHPSVFGPFARLFGYPHISHTLTYVLGGKHPPNQIFANPYYGKGAIVVLRGPTAKPGRWYTEMRNIEDDIRVSFSSAPMLKALKYIVISADTDDKGATSRARIAALRFDEIPLMKTDD